MFTVVKFVPVFALSVGLLSTFSLPAHALSVIKPVEQNQATGGEGQQRHYPLAAFAGDAGANADKGNFLLSPEEVQHVKWCAQQYMSYHPVDNTYQASSGQRLECQSPY